MAFGKPIFASQAIPSRIKDCVSFIPFPKNTHMKKLMVLTLLIMSVLPSFPMERKASIFEISQKSDVIFYGIVKNIESHWNSKKNMIFTDVTFGDLYIIWNNDRSFQAKSPEIILQMAGGTVDGVGMSVSGNPKFEVGMECLVMTKDDGRVYSNPITGGNQGLFTILRDAITGEKYLLSSGGRVVGFDSLGFEFLSKEKVTSVQNGIPQFTKSQENPMINVPPVPSNSQNSGVIVLPSPPEPPLIRIQGFIQYLRQTALKKTYTPVLIIGQSDGVRSKTHFNSAKGVYESEKVSAPNHSPGPVSNADYHTVPKYEENNLQQDYGRHQNGVENQGPYSPAGGAMGSCGYHNLFLVMEELPSSWVWYSINEDCMWQWNQFMDIYRVTASNGFYGWLNGVNEFSGWLTNADLFDTYGFNWGSGIGMTIMWWYCNCCEIQESDVCYNYDYLWTDDFDYALDNSSVIYFKTVTIHEQGHTWGYMDGTYTETYDYDLASVMQGYYSDVVENSYGIHTEDAYQIRAHYSNQTGILGRTDMGVESYWASDGLHNSSADYGGSPGDELNIYHITVENLSNAAVNDVRLRFYLSTNKTITTTDYQCGGNEYWHWATYGQNSFSVADYSTTIPEDIPGGQYYIGAIVTINGFNSDDYDPNNSTFLDFTLCIRPPQPGAISGSTTVCAGVGHTYSIAAVAGATSYSWLLPSGWSGSSSTTSIYVTPGSNSGSIKVNALNLCGYSHTQSKEVTVMTAPGQPGSISGSSTVCPDTVCNYSISSVTGASSYTWTLPSGWSGSSTTTSINATSGSSGGIIYVTANNSCGSSSASPKYVSVFVLPSQPGAISGPSEVCIGSTNTYSISAVTGATFYTWTLPAGWTGSSSSNSIDITAGTTRGTLYVTGNNLCGAGPATAMSIFVVSVPLNETVTNVIIPSGQSLCTDATQTINVAGGGNYFIVQSGGSATFEAAQSIDFLPGANINSGGYMHAFIISNPCCGAGGPVDKPTVDGSGIQSIEQNPIHKQNSLFFKVYPNPTHGKFTLELTEYLPNTLTNVQIFGIWGENVYTITLSGERKHEISLTDKPVGIYFIKVMAGEKAGSAKIINQ
jgi:hypothetical protein